MNTAKYSKEPAKIRHEKDGSSVICWDIVAKKNDDGDDIYECKEARCYLTPTSDNLTRAAIVSQWPHDTEAKLINENIASMIANGKPTAAYEEFLAERQRIKDVVDATLAEEKQAKTK